MMKRFLSSVFVMFIFSVSLLAQEYLSDITSKLALYNAMVGDSRIYVHTNKSSYNPSETILFKGYIIDNFADQPKIFGDSINIIIVGEAGSKVAESRLEINNNVFSGSIQLPSSASGRYNMVAFSSKTSALGIGRTFAKPIDVEASAKLDFTAKIDESSLNNDQLKVDFTVLQLDGKPAVNASISIKATNNKKKVKASAKTDNNGKASVTMKIPSDGMGWMLQADAKYAKLQQSVNLPVRYTGEWLRAFFSPEGKTLVAGVPTNIYGAVSDIFGNIGFSKASIVDSDGNITSMSQNNGFYSANITPKVGKTYKVLVNYPGKSTTEIELPKVETEGVVLSFVSADENKIAIKLSATNPEKIQDAILVGYAQCKIIYSSKVNMIAKEMISTVSTDKIGEEAIHFALLKNNDVLSELSVFAPKSGNITISGDKFNLSGVQYPTNVSVAVVGKDKYDMGIVKTFSLLEELPHGLYPIVWNMDNNASPEDYSKVLSLASLFSWSSVININSLPIAKSLPLNTIWFSYLQKYALNNFRSPKTPFSDQIYEITPREKVNAHNNKDVDYSNFSSMLDVVRTEKLFNIVNGQIVFNGSANSIYHQEGALIVIDNVMRGSDISCLDEVVPMEVAKIEVSADPSDIQEYTGLNSVGIIKIYTIYYDRKNNSHLPQSTAKVFGNKKYFANEAGASWDDYVLFNASEIKSIDKNVPNNNSQYYIKVNGLTDSGVPIYGERVL